MPSSPLPVSPIFLFEKKKQFIPFLYPLLLPPTGSDSSTRIMFLERFHEESAAVVAAVLSSSRATERWRAETVILPREIALFLLLFLFLTLTLFCSRKRESRERGGFAPISHSRAIPRSIRREPRAIMNYLAAAVSCRAGRDGGLFFFPGSDGFRFSADAANSASRSRGP